MTGPWGTIGLAKKLEAFAKEQHDAAARALTLAAEHVLQVSEQQVPLRDGHLQQSGKTSVAEDDLVAVISYDTPYAVVQHEDMTFNHPNGRKAKYLEDPMHSEADAVKRILANELGEAYK